VGDFNLDPFDQALVSTNGFHAVLSRAVAARQQRKVSGKSYDFFYNPMWGRMGDGSHGPPGSHYYSSTEHVAYFWHSFDQVLLRPSLLHEFDDQSLMVLTHIGKESLLKHGIPDKVKYSDHLPLLFSIHPLPKEALL
jgi:hypothetical protein